MSEADIQRMIFEITTRYGKEAHAKNEEIRIKHGSKGIGEALRTGYDRQLRQRISTAIIQEVGDYIIRPYTNDPQKTIARFHEWIRETYIRDFRNNLYPELDEFIDWYCDSDTIRAEVRNERENIKDDPRLLPR